MTANGSYISSNGTLEGDLRLVDAVYSPFEMGAVFDQYVAEVSSSSSFWGNPPNIEASRKTTLHMPAPLPTCIQ